MHSRPISPVVALLTIIFLAACVSEGRADEGMWLFNYPPKKLLKEKHDFEPTDAWLAHLQQSAVRFNNGGSGSFVSADGLVMTNHHVGADALQKLSTKDRDLMQSSFYARTQAEETQVPRLGTERADEHRGRDRAGQRRGHGGRRFGRGRKAAPRGDEHHRKGIVRQDRPAQRRGHALPGRAVSPLPLQEVHRRAAGLRPEEDIAFFGGDPDNFEYPRYDLDICFFRVYENGKPAKVPHYLEVEPGGHEGGRPGVRRGQSRQDRPPEHGAAPGVPPRRTFCPRRSTCCGGARCCWCRSASGAPRTPGGPRTCC